MGLSECFQIIKIWLSIHTCQTSLNANALELYLKYSLVQHLRVVREPSFVIRHFEGTCHLTASIMNSMAAFTALSRWVYLIHLSPFREFLYGKGVPSSKSPLASTQLCSLTQNNVSKWAYLTQSEPIKSIRLRKGVPASMWVT